MFMRLRQWRQRRVVARHPIEVELWSHVLADHRLFDRFTPAERRRLHELATLFLHEKRIFGTHALEITDFMRVTVAAQAVVPVVNLDLSYYRGWTVILLYPGTFIARHEFADEVGVVHVVEEELDGESMEAGPLVISWEQASASPRRFPGTNLIIHELAHKLDYLNGDANGLPPLHADMSIEAWASAFGDAYADMNERLDHNRPVPLDGYAAESPAEFFAVMSEAFFETPDDLMNTYPDVFQALAAFYRQSPLERLKAMH